MRQAACFYLTKKTMNGTKYITNHIVIIAILSLVASVCAVSSLADEGSGNWGDFEKVEKAKSVDHDDIEETVDKAIRVAENKRRGVVWGKSGKATEIKKDDDKADESGEKKTKGVEEKTEKKSDAKSEETNPDESIAVAQRTTVKRPVVAPKTSPKSSNSPALPSTIDNKSYLLKSSRKNGSTDLVETLLEVTGDAKQVDNDMQAITEKMEVVAGFRYEERIDQYSLTTNDLRSIRQYNLAKAKMKIGENLKTPHLNESMQTIVCKLEKTNKVSLFSPKGPLRGEELLLIEDLPGNTLTLDRLLPNKEVKIGDSWKVSDAVLQSFLSIDAVIENSVDAVLTAVADNMAMVEVVGDIQGVYLGAPTQMSIRAKYQFDMDAKRINWLGLLIEENRSIGHVGPGFDLVARLQVKISPIETPETLTDTFMAMVDTKTNDTVLGLKYDDGKAPWSFLHGRDWYVFQDDAQSTILRKVHKGELVAQCNIADMGKVDVKTMTSLDKFQKELAEGLGESFGEVAYSSETTNKFGYKNYSVLIDGVVDDLELRWIYNLLTDKDGRQSVVVFVVEAGMLEQFGDADEALLDTFRMGRGNKTEN